MEANMNNLIDDQELQRLLDDALPAEDRALLLQYADDNPSNWRRIAMAFIEEQILRDELSKLVEFDSLPSEHVVRTEETPPVSSRVWTSVLGQAAVLCLMLGAAVWVGRTSVDQQDKQVIGDEAAGGYTISPPPESLTPESAPSSVGFDQLANSGLQNNQDAVKRMFRPLFDQQSQMIFRDHGYTVNEDPVVYVVHGHQGEQYVVPRRNVSFVAHRE
jgi:hypothetical protein